MKGLSSLDQRLRSDRPSTLCIIFLIITLLTTMLEMKGWGGQFVVLRKRPREGCSAAFQTAFIDRFTSLDADRDRDRVKRSWWTPFSSGNALSLLPFTSHE